MTIPESGSAELGELLASLVETLPLQQQRLDEDFLRRLEALAPVLREVAAEDRPALARALAPSAWVWQQVEVSAGVRASRSRGRELAIESRLLNLGYRRKYAYSEFAESRLKIVVARVPMPPPRPPNLRTGKGSADGEE